MNPTDPAIPTFRPDPVQTARLAAILRENAPIHARIGDAAFAATCANVAIALEMLLVLTSLPVPLAAPSEPLAPTSKPPRQRAITGAQKAEAALAAAEWLNAYRERLQPTSGAPSARAIWAAYKRDATAPVIPRAVLLAARPPEWKMEVRQ